MRPWGWSGALLALALIAQPLAAQELIQTNRDPAPASEQARDAPPVQPPAEQPQVQPSQPPQAEPVARRVPSLEAIMARLRERAEARRTLEAAEAAPIARTGAAERGALIAALPVRYKRVGYLQGDLVLDTLFTRARVVLPRYARVYATRFLMGEGYRVERVEAWCGVAPEAGRPTGFCLLDMESGPQVAETPRVTSPYMPRELGNWHSTEAVEVLEDARAQADLPTLELTYVFTEFDAHDVDVMTGVRVDGGEIVDNYNLSLPRAADGSALLRVGGGALRIRPGADRRSALVEQVAPLIGYNAHVEDDEALRAMAERIRARMIEDAAKASPSAPAP